MWLGAHPGGPSTVDRAGERVSLTDLLVAEPDHWLGDQVVDRFGTRLPFLMKVLAADAPLCLQAHPDAEQAQAGYAAEQARPAAGRTGPVELRRRTPQAGDAGRADASSTALCGFRAPGRGRAAVAQPELLARAAR